MMTIVTNDEELVDGFFYNLVRTYYDGDPDEPPPPLGCSIDLDYFQVFFDPEERQLRINLSLQQVARLLTWGWTIGKK